MSLPLAVLGGIFYFMFLSGHFTIRDVKISGLETIPREEILINLNKIFNQKKFGVLGSNNYFIFPGAKLQASLREQFPKIGLVRIEKINPDGINIVINERKAIGVWCYKISCFYFDKGGVVFEEAPKSTGSLMLSIDDEAANSAELGDVVLRDGDVEFFQSVQGITVRSFSFGVKGFLITPDGEFEVTTTEDWQIFLDKSESPQYQLSNLKYVLDEEVKTRRRELEYVDLRLGNRVYYKYLQD